MTNREILNNTMKKGFFDMSTMVDEYDTLRAMDAAREDEAGKIFTMVVTMKQMLAYGEWARVNGERWRGNLQKNGIELYNQYLKEKESWEKMQ